MQLKLPRWRSQNCDKTFSEYHLQTVDVSENFFPQLRALQQVQPVGSADIILTERMILLSRYGTIYAIQTADRMYGDDSDIHDESRTPITALRPSFKFSGSRMTPRWSPSGRHKIPINWVSGIPGDKEDDSMKTNKPVNILRFSSTEESILIIKRYASDDLEWSPWKLLNPTTTTLQIQKGCFGPNILNNLISWRGYFRPWSADLKFGVKMAPL